MEYLETSVHNDMDYKIAYFPSTPQGETKQPREIPMTLPYLVTYNKTMIFCLTSVLNSYV